MIRADILGWDCEKWCGQNVLVIAFDIRLSHGQVISTGAGRIIMD